MKVARRRLADMSSKEQAYTVIRMLRAAGLNPRSYEPQEALKWALGLQRKQTDA